MLTRTLLVSLMAVSCAPGRAAPDLVERSGLAMGSSLRVAVWTADEDRARRAIDVAFAEFARLERLMSTWVKDSDVSRINASAGIAPVEAAPETREALEAARQISVWTDGRFDVTFGALSGLWKFDHDRDGVVPDMWDVRRRLPLIDFRAVRVDDPAGTVSVARRGVSIHLGGIGKGYAIDRASALLRQSGFEDFLIQSGGDLYAAGRKDSGGWSVGIQDPRGQADQVFATLELSDAALSTSGDYERYFVKDGTRYHHIIDPQTGTPARGVRSVTVITNRSVIADGLSTGIFVLGPEAGLALAERLPGVDAVMVTDRNELLVSSGLREGLAVVRPLSDANN